MHKKTTAFVCILFIHRNNRKHSNKITRAASLVFWDPVIHERTHDSHFYAYI